jgi:hypothetical protein
MQGNTAAYLPHDGIYIGGQISSDVAKLFRRFVVGPKTTSCRGCLNFLSLQVRLDVLKVPCRR